MIEALDQYFADEQLTGDNKYECTGGDRNGEKVDVFQRKYIEAFPSVLCMLLKRFAYDTKTNQSTKLTSRFEFEENINLSKHTYLPGVDVDYTLHAILVHDGLTLTEGHYFVCVNINGNWTKYDDAIVSNCSKSQAIKDNFNGESSAYMLVYVRDAAKSSVLCDVSTMNTEI